MESVPHGQHSDILHDIGVSLVAGEIETFVREKYVSGSIIKF